MASEILQGDLPGNRRQGSQPRDARRHSGHDRSAAAAAGLLGTMQNTSSPGLGGVLLLLQACLPGPSTPHPPRP